MVPLPTLCVGEGDPPDTEEEVEGEGVPVLDTRALLEALGLPELEGVPLAQGEAGTLLEALLDPPTRLTVAQAVAEGEGESVFAGVLVALPTPPGLREGRGVPLEVRLAVDALEPEVDRVGRVEKEALPVGL